MRMDGRHAVSCVWRGDAPDPGGAGRNHDLCWLRAIHIRVFRLSSSGPATRRTMKSGHSQKSECSSPLDGSRARNMGVSAQVAWAHARSNLHGWTIGSFISWRHRAVSILIVGIIITMALAGSLITWDGVKGPTGDQGPAGPKGPTGDPGPPGQESARLRVVQSNCDQTSCTAQCGESEILLTAYCGPKRNAALISTDRTATCRTRVPANNPLVAVCAAMPSP